MYVVFAAFLLVLMAPQVLPTLWSWEVDQWNKRYANKKEEDVKPATEEQLN
jgi:hypothetical protein